MAVRDAVVDRNEAERLFGRLPQENVIVERRGIAPELEPARAVLRPAVVRDDVAGGVGYITRNERECAKRSGALVYLSVT